MWLVSVLLMSATLCDAAQVPSSYYILSNDFPASASFLQILISFIR